MHHHEYVLFPIICCVRFLSFFSCSIFTFVLNVFAIFVTRECRPNDNITFRWISRSVETMVEDVTKYVRKRFFTSQTNWYRNSSRKKSHRKLSRNGQWTWKLWSDVFESNRGMMARCGVVTSNTKRCSNCQEKLVEAALRLNAVCFEKRLLIANFYFLVVLQ